MRTLAYTLHKIKSVGFRCVPYTEKDTRQSMCRVRYTGESHQIILKLYTRNESENPEMSRNTRQSVRVPDKPVIQVNLL